jgi:peptidoglycan lytic transglycosylase G
LRRCLFILILLGLVAVVAWLGYALFLPLPPAGHATVLLRPGSSTRHIATELRAAGVIRSVPGFLLVNAWHHKALKAGEYSFDQPASAVDVYERIARGDMVVHTVVIPEGYNLYEIAAALQEAGLGRADDFVQVARSDVRLVQDLDPQATSLEGYLFPDTYHFSRTQNLHDIAGAMVHHFRREAGDLGLTANVHEVVTMASIVEKETSVPDERPLVASVYYNRLARGIPFGADPTVVYASLLAGRYRGVIHESDLQLDSPYNTYKRVGLPPGPIANPGRAALAAAMHPAKSDFLFFVSDNQGHHRFARTAAEHARNVAAYRRATNH